MLAWVSLETKMPFFLPEEVRLDLGENLFQMLLGSCLIFHLMEKDAVWNLLFPAKIFKPFDSTVCRDTFGGRIVDVEKHFTVVTIEQTGRLDRTHVVIGVDAADVSILPARSLRSGYAGWQVPSKGSHGLK